MRTISGKGAVLVVLSAAAMLVACGGPTYTNPMKKSREDAAVDVLDCQKAAVLKFKAVRLRRSDSTSFETRQAAARAARVAWDSCLKSRGWEKKG